MRSEQTRAIPVVFGLCPPPTVMHHATPLPCGGQLVAGRFRLVRPLGQGGMGSVWLAEQTALRTPCALKFLHPSVAVAAEMRARFEREAVAAAQLRSPHVVHILDHGMWEGAPYIAMELLEGEDLDQRLERGGALPARETAAIVSQVARALTRAHAAGLVHRDLKPANLFLVRDDDREIVKVLDFGIAKVRSAEPSGVKTETGAILGTPCYMSPEQVRGLQEIDARSNLWSLAVIAFRCVTGELPFKSGSIGDLLVQIMVGPIPVPSEVARVPAGFDAFWTRAAARNPRSVFRRLVSSPKPWLSRSRSPLGMRASSVTPQRPSSPPPLRALQSRKP